MIVFTLMCLKVENLQSSLITMTSLSERLAVGLIVHLSEDCISWLLVVFPLTGGWELEVYYCNIFWSTWRLTGTLTTSFCRFQYFETILKRLIENLISGMCKSTTKVRLNSTRNLVSKWWIWRKTTTNGFIQLMPTFSRKIWNQFKMAQIIKQRVHHLKNL